VINPANAMQLAEQVAVVTENLGIKTALIGALAVHIYKPPYLLANMKPIPPRTTLALLMRMNSFCSMFFGAFVFLSVFLMQSH
jgi:hypothetical protein